MDEKELREEYKKLKEQNRFRTNKLAAIARVTSAYAIMGKDHVPVKDIEEILTSRHEF